MKLSDEEDNERIRRVVEERVGVLVVVELGGKWTSVRVEEEVVVVELVWEGREGEDYKSFLP